MFFLNRSFLFTAGGSPFADVQGDLTARFRLARADVILDMIQNPCVLAPSSGGVPIGGGNDRRGVASSGGVGFYGLWFVLMHWHWKQ